MKHGPIRPARIRFEGGVPVSDEFGDVYHSRSGACAQAMHVFLGGNRLPERWRGRQRFVIVETGFGLGHNFLATWLAWQQDAARCDQLWYVAVDKHPPTRSDLALAHRVAAETAPAADPPVAVPATLAAQLVAAWPELTPDLHSLHFEGGRLRLLLSLGEAADVMRHWALQADASYLDGFAPVKNPALWDERIFKSCARLAAPGATAATWSVAQAVQQGLRRAGFDVDEAAGLPPKRTMTVARFAPRVTPPQAAGRRAAAFGGPAAESDAQLRDASDDARGASSPRALVIGAGLAGASVARALAEQGWQVRVLEKQPLAAQGASGNPAGLFHGVVHSNDGAHARLLRAAALRAGQVLPPLMAAGQVMGSAAGLLRLEDGLSASDMRRLAADGSLPTGYVDVFDTAAASDAAGLPLAWPAWHYPKAGWLAPQTLVNAWLDHPHITLTPNAEVAALRPPPTDAHADPSARWQARGAQGQLLAEASVVVIANAADAQRLLGPALPWPIQAVRGQVTMVSAAAAPLPLPRRPLAHRGYVIALPAALGGGLLCGATSQPGDTDPALRAADHCANLALAERLLGRTLAVEPSALQGRVGWRMSADDRLPVIGPVPDLAASALTALGQEQPRHVPRQPGLYVYTGLGSRGITLAPLLGEVLASWITGAPVPLDTGLIDAIDVARFVCRAARHAARGPQKNDRRDDENAPRSDTTGGVTDPP